MVALLGFVFKQLMVLHLRKILGGQYLLNRERLVLLVQQALLALLAIQVQLA
jgi:hypothetical protein